MSSQVKNLKSRMAKEKIKHFGVLFFSLFLTLAIFSQIAVKAAPDVALGSGKNLQSATYQPQPSDWLYYKSNNDLSAYLGKKDTKLPTVRYQKGSDYLEFSLNQAAINNQTTGISTATSPSLETKEQDPNNPTLFYRNILDGTDANYRITNLPFKVKEEITLYKNPNDKIQNKDLTFIFNAETSAKPVKQSDGSIAFFDNQNNYLFQLDKPFMMDAKGTRSEEVGIEIISTQTKTADKSAVFGDSNLSRKSGLLPINKQYIGIKNIVNRLVDIKNVLDLGGIEPPESRVAIRAPLQARPRTNIFYHKEKETEIAKQYQIILKVNTEWLSTATYPVVIDPTITHNADANFTGQMNRVADSDTTSNTQLESSYGEATKDPYTVLLLHFNEANGSTNIKDYASTTRVITANGNASTTNYVTQLGMGNSGAFDGNGDYLSLDNSAVALSGFSTFTATMWINRSSVVAGDTSTLISNDHDAGNGQTYNMYTGTSGQIYWYSRIGGSVYSVTSSTNTDIGKWYFLAFVYDGSKMQLYINGILNASTPATGTMRTSINNSMRIGMRTDALLPFNGFIDDLKISNRALTPEEIKTAASRRPYAVYTSPALDASASVAWNTLNWTEGGVNTGNGETLYNTNSLVAQWDFNETSGTTATSSTSGSCQACAGTLNGFSYTSSQDQATTTTGWTANNKRWGAGALMFDGVNDYVSVPDGASLEITSAITVEAWVKPNTLSGIQHILSKWWDGTNRSYDLYLNGSTAIFNLAFADSNTDHQASSTNLVAGNWYHIVGTYDGSTIKTYVNGILGESLSYTGTIRTNNVQLAIGVDGRATPIEYFSGIIDSTRIYSRALSASEILSNYNVGNVEIQTRTGVTSDPNDGTWEAWKPTTGETQLLSLDSDAVNWRSDIMASTTIATSTDTVIKAEGTGSLKVKMGMASTTAGTVALWHFEETGTTTGTYLYDSTSNHNDVTTTGTTVVDGIFGKARKFNGTSDYVSKDSGVSGVGGTSAMTLETWVNRNNDSSGTIIAGGNTSGYQYFRLELNYNNVPGSIRADFGNDANNDYSIKYTTTNSVSSGSWHHIVATYNAGVVRIYVDGLEVSGTTAGTWTGNVVTPTTYLRIGNQYANGNASYFSGIIDSTRISNRILSPDEIAETYRMGANHHLTRQVSATDMSSANKLAFNVASDRPGTYLEAMIGKSDYANYELASSTLALSTTTVLYIKGDEIASSTSIKDSSFSGKAITANGNARTSGRGKIGNSVYFDGTSGTYLSLADSDDWTWGINYSVDMWVNPTNFTGGADQGIELVNHAMENPNDFWRIYIGKDGACCARKVVLDIYQGTPLAGVTSSVTLATSQWYHIAIVKMNSNYYMYINSQLVGSVTTATAMNNNSGTVRIGNDINGTGPLNGYIDELRIIKGTALSADQIRQAYEYGLRRHQITIDFGASLQPSDLISSATDYSFSITATTSGLSATTSGLYLGDKIVIKENLGGTEYTAQGTVNSINSTTGAITVSSWDTGSTFPAGNGYSPNATVFKWQREYFDLGGAATTTRDAITNLTLRPTNGAEGRTIYLDDFRYNTNYLTASSSSSITSSNGRYLQYRAIFSSWDSFVSPYLSAINTLYALLPIVFPPAIGISGGGFLSF